jgi:hypothetical protein
VSLPDQLERAGIVLGSILMVSLPASLVLSVVTGTSTPWWSALLLVIPGFVVGWAIATERAPFDYDSLWFVCFVGYVGTVAAVAALGLEATEGDGRLMLGVAAVAFLAAGLVDRYRE